MAISSDGGENWQPASLGENSAPNSWRLWDYEWQVPAARGTRTLVARATDSRGRTQPMERDQNRGGYMINHCLPLEVEIR